MGSALFVVGVTGLGLFFETPIFPFYIEWGLANSFIFVLGGIILLGRRNSHSPVMWGALVPAALCWLLGALFFQVGGWVPLFAALISITAGSILMFVGIIRTTPNTPRTTL